MKRSTGFKDCNEVEIMEGDTVRIGVCSFGYDAGEHDEIVLWLKDEDRFGFEYDRNIGGHPFIWWAQHQF
jgi:hypothetical protein